MKMMNIPKEVQLVLDLLYKNNYEGYIVGGAVRDYLLGRIPNDYDIATNATIAEINNLFKNYKLIHINLNHDTITIYIDEINIEITSYRDKGNTLRGDLLLRDFTINAVAFSPKEGIIDYYGGLADIENKIIRLNGDDECRLIEDPLRILRAIRISSQLNFVIDSLTKEYLIKNLELLKYASKERIGVEFSKFLLSPHPSDYIREYFDVITTFIPELIPLKGFEQNNPWHVYDCLEHTLKVIDNTEPLIIMRLSALFHDSGKPHTYTEDENHIGHFRNHQKVSMEIAKKVLKRLKYSNKIIRKVVNLIDYHDYPLILTRNSVRKLLNYFGVQDIHSLLMLKRADNLAQNPERWHLMLNIEDANKMIDEMLAEDDCFSLRKLRVKGSDLIKIGIAEGKEIGEILNELLNLVIDEEIPNDYDILLETAKKIKEKR